MAEQVKDQELELKPGNDVETDIRQIRNAVMVIAWIVGIAAAVSLIIGIVVGVQIAKVEHSINGSSVSSSNCYSAGGNDLSC